MRKTLNKLKIFANFATGRHIFDIYPSQVALEVTNRCNLACVICPHGKMTRPKGLMPFEKFRTYVDKTARHAEFIYLYGIGESLLHPDLDKMIDYAQSAGIYTYLSTNAMPMDEKWSARLLTSRLKSLTFALDGFTKAQYEAIRVKGRFATVIENIRAFLRLKKQMRRRMHVVIQTVATDETPGDAGQLTGLFSDAELSQVSQIRVKPFYDSFPERRDEACGLVRKCFFLWNFLFAYQDGRVGLCCVDYDGQTILGDLNEQDCREIWNSKRLREIRRAYHKRRSDALPLCRTCRLPEISGFGSCMLLASSLVPTGVSRKLLPLYEKLRLRKLRPAAP